MKSLKKRIVCSLISVFMILSPCASAYAAGGEVAGAVAEAMGAAGYVPWNNLLSGILTGLGISAEAQIGVLLESASYKAEQSKLVNTEEFKAIEKAKLDAWDAAVAAGLAGVKNGVKYGYTYVKNGANYVSKGLLDVCAKSFEKAKLFTAKTISPQTMTAGSYLITKDAFMDPETGLNYMISSRGVSLQGAALIKMAFNKCMEKKSLDDVIGFISIYSDSNFLSSVSVNIDLFDSKLFPSFPIDFDSYSDFVRSKIKFKSRPVDVKLYYDSYSNEYSFEFYKYSHGGILDGSYSTEKSIYSCFSFDLQYIRMGLFNFSSAKPFTWSVTDNLPKFKTVDGYTSVELPSWAGQPETVPAGQVAEGQEAYPVSIPALNGISDKVEDLAKALQGLTQAQAQAGTIPDSLKDVITNLKDVTKAVEDASSKSVSLDILEFLKSILQKILDGILSIPGVLADIKNAVIALPASIAASMAKVIPSAAEKTVSDEDSKIPGLADVFPFCIPFDLIAFIRCLKADPEAPHFTFPIKYPKSFDSWGEYDLDIDLSSFDSIAELVRKFELLIFCIALVLITRDHMIKG